MTVSLRVASFLKKQFKYDLPSLYVYDGVEQKFSIESCKNPIPAPTIMEAVNFLWKVGIQIYYLPEGNGCRGVIKVGNRFIKLKRIKGTPQESYLECLEFLSKAGH